MSAIEGNGTDRDVGRSLSSKMAVFDEFECCEPLGSDHLGVGGQPQRLADHVAPRPDDNRHAVTRCLIDCALQRLAGIANRRRCHTSTEPYVGGSGPAGRIGAARSDRAGTKSGGSYKQIPSQTIHGCTRGPYT